MYFFANIIDNIKNNFKSHPIFYILLILFLALEFAFELSESVYYSHKTNMALKCTLSTNQCTLDQYSYKRKVCWNRLYRSLYHSRYSSRYPSCPIKTYLNSETPLLKFSEINSVAITKEKAIYNLYLISKDGNKYLVYSNDNIEKVKNHSKSLRTRLNKFISDSYKSEFIGSDTFKYVFE